MVEHSILIKTFRCHNCQQVVILNPISLMFHRKGRCKE